MKDKPAYAPQDVYLTGHERIHWIQDLLGLDHEKDPQVRRIGRTTRMAVRYAHLALHTPGCKVIVEDHFQDNGAHRHLLRIVERIMEVLNVEYEIGTDDGWGDHGNPLKSKVWIRVTPLRQW